MFVPFGFGRAPSGRIFSGWVRLACAAVPLCLAACASLPTSGPTARDITKDARNGRTSIPFTLVPLDASIVRDAAPATVPGIARLAALGGAPIEERADRIMPGDTLTISIFEVGVALFGGGGSAPSAATVSRPPTAAGQVLTVEVREDGTITLPYIGRVKAADTYPEDLAAVIRRRLKPLSESPEVAVDTTASVRNVVTIGGAVAKSGRYRLTAAHERLLDVLALAGGSQVDPNELEVTLQRAGQDVTAPLNHIEPGDPADLLIEPGDRIQLVRVRSSYSVFGASDRVSQIYFDAKDVSLAEAIARAGGPSDYRANPRGVFLCRYVMGADGQPKPVVYQLNMMRTDAYLLAQRFPMHDKDVLLFANASGTVTQKLVGLLSSLFTPVATVRYATTQ